MSKIRIKNFGPIKEGYLENDGWLDIGKTTVFIGNQGSGKSTVAKLTSTLTWIEKATVKGELQESELSTYNRFIKRLEYQRIKNYIKDDTEIEYQGDAYSFKFLKGAFTATKKPENGYNLPKIMYVPAERNFLSVVDRPDKLKELPLPIYTFLNEYDRARNVFWEGLVLPINQVVFRYDRQNKIAHIVEKDGNTLRLSEASSGFQSTVPLYLVTKYLAEWLNKDDDSSVKNISIEEERKLEKEIKRITEDPELTAEVKQVYLRQLSAKRKPSCFINIVEEPEQNLFPTSQKSVLFELLHYNNTHSNNKLIFTTHSPYLINALTLAVKAFKVSASCNSEDQRQQVAKIVPTGAQVNPLGLVIYELDEKEGIIQRLEDYKGLPSDENYLNELIAETNECFAQLQEIEKTV